MSDSQIIELDLEGGQKLVFQIKRDDFIKFVNGVGRNTFNAQQNLLVSSVTAEHKEALTSMLSNPANVIELAGAVIEEYKADVAVAVKKRKTSQTA